mgnify:CR=1 FL=1
MAIRPLPVIAASAASLTLAALLRRWCRGRPPVASEPVIPPCESVVPTEVLQALFSPHLVFLGSPPQPISSMSFPDPAGQAAWPAATQQRRCWWGIPNSDGSVSIDLLVLPATAMSTLQSALAGSSFTHEVIVGRDAYWTMVPSELSDYYQFYAFIGPIWISVGTSGVDTARAAASVAVATLAAANPGIG